MESNQVLFTEKQRFNPWIVGVFVALTILFTGVAINQQILQNIPFGDSPMTDMGLVITTIVLVLFSCLFFSIRLETKIHEEGIYVRFFPFHIRYRFYAWSEINSIAVREYSPLLEYGGWGIRGFGKNRALNISGNVGLQLTFQSGKRLLIGTKKGQQINELLKTTPFITPKI